MTSEPTKTNDVKEKDIAERVKEATAAPNEKMKSIIDEVKEDVANLKEKAEDAAVYAQLEIDGRGSDENEFHGPVFNGTHYPSYEEFYGFTKDERQTFLSSLSFDDLERYVSYLDEYKAKMEEQKIN